MKVSFRYQYRSEGTVLVQISKIYDRYPALGELAKKLKLKSALTLTPTLPSPLNPPPLAKKISVQTARNWYLKVDLSLNLVSLNSGLTFTVWNPTPTPQNKAGKPTVTKCVHVV